MGRRPRLVEPDCPALAGAAGCRGEAAAAEDARDTVNAVRARPDSKRSPVAVITPDGFGAGFFVASTTRTLVAPPATSSRSASTTCP